MKKLFVVLSVFVMLIAVGCVTKETTYKKTTQTDGTVIEETNIKSDGSLLTEKTVAYAGSIQAAKAESTGGSTTQTIAPNAIVGGANSAGIFSPVGDNRPVMAYSKSTSFLGSLASISAAGISWVYVGVKDETAEQTEQRLASLKLFTGLSHGTTDSSTSE